MTFNSNRALNLETSVKLELNSSTPTLKLLTTSDGTLQGLLLPEETFPSWIERWAKKNHPEVTDTGKLPWDALNPDQQLKLLQSVSKKRNQDFFVDRFFHGLKVRKNIQLKFNHRTKLSGRIYKKGIHEVDTSSFVVDKITYSGPSEIKSGSGIEIHFQNDAHDAWTLLEGIEIPRNQQRIHITSRIPIEALTKDPNVQSALLGDFFKRSNLAAEMIDVVEGKNSIYTRNTSPYASFDSLTPENLAQVTQYFQDLGKGKKPVIAQDFTQGWVGMNGSGLYDQPGFWGIEVNSISKNPNPETAIHFVDSLQSSLNKNSYGVSEEQMIGWIKTQNQSDIPGLLKKSLYNQTWKELFNSAPAQTRTEISGFWGWLKKHLLRSKSQNNRELKMLIFDWSHDPLIFNQAELKTKILSEQLKAIRRILNHEKIGPVVSDFLVESGLYEKVLTSLGMSPERILPPNSRRVPFNRPTIQ